MNIFCPQHINLTSYTIILWTYILVSKMNLFLTTVTYCYLKQHCAEKEWKLIQGLLRILFVYYIKNEM